MDRSRRPQSNCGPSDLTYTGQRHQEAVLERGCVHTGNRIKDSSKQDRHEKELQAHFEPASETEGVEKDADEVEDDCHPMEQNGNEEPVVTSGVSTLSSVVSHESQQQHLNLQLAKLKQETNRLLEVLVQKEREYQTLLRQTLEQKTQELHLLQLQSKPAEFQRPPGAPVQNVDQELLDWLRQQGADSDAIERFAEEDYTLNDVLNDITKDDLRYLRLRGGLLCRIWNAILNHRKMATKPSETNS